MEMFMRKLLLASTVERAESSCCIFFLQGIKATHSYFYLKQTKPVTDLSFSLNKLSDQLRLALASRSFPKERVREIMISFFLFLHYIIIMEQVSGYATQSLTSFHYKDRTFQLPSLSRWTANTSWCLA